MRFLSWSAEDLLVNTKDNRVLLYLGTIGLVAP